MNQSNEANQPDGTANEWTKEKPEAESSWDPSAFDQQKPGEWDESKEHGATVTRLQDLSLGMGSSHSQENAEKKEESWPYESSPCKMYGGKNTRPGNEEMNKELFKTSDFEKKDSFSSFAEGSDDEFGMEAVAEESEEEEESEEAEEEEPPKRLERKSSRRASLKGNVVRAVMNGDASAYDQVLDNAASAAPPTRPVRTVSRSTSDPKIDPTKVRKPAKKRDELAVSCHAGIETRTAAKPPKKSSRRSKDDSGDTSGDAEPSAPSRRGPPSRVPPRRTRTGDGLEDLSRHRANGRDELEKRERPRRKPPKPTDRRSLMTRAMSTQNVKKPEDYGPRATGGAAAAGGGDDLGSSTHSTTERHKASARRRMSSQRSASQRSLNKESKSRSREPESDSEEEVDDEEDKAPERKLTRQPSRRVRGTSSRAPEPKRDLLILLRDQKTVVQKDLKDKENRRLLHFLIYEHKMGVSLAGLEKSIRQEKEDGIEPDRRQRLYIETA